jgi:hypothetical protein
MAKRFLDWLTNAQGWQGLALTQPAPIIERDEDDMFGFPYEDGIKCPLCGDWVDKYRPCRKRKARGL